MIAIRIIRLIWNHPANRNTRFVALARAALWQLYKRLTRRHWDIRVWGGMRLRCYPDSTSASSVLYFGGLPDYHEMSFMRNYLRGGDGFLDVGANIGVYTIYAASLLGRHGFVDSFEPDDDAVQRFHENLAINDLTHVRVHKAAVGAVAGSVRLTKTLDTGNHLVLDEASEIEITKNVSCVRLDEFLKGRRYALGKMDIEGAEPLALQGAEQMLADSNPPVWLLEINGLLHRYNFTETGLRNWLIAHEYEVAVYDADSGELLWGGEPWNSRSNVLCIARSAREDVIRRLAPQ